jgi:hypothetical protein
MIKATSKPKRGAQFKVKATGAIVWLDRIQENGNYFCRTTPPEQIDPEYEVFKPSGLTPHFKANAPIKSKSDKRRADERVYSTLRKVFLESHPYCQAGLQGCRGRSTEVHHKAGRTGDLYLNVKFWLACCRHCHDWIGLHPTEAIAKGLSIPSTTV